jgi:O-antigen/teichoic acid export membrane protein
VTRVARHLVRSTASNLAGQGVVVCVWFAVTPFVVHELGATRYGLWALVGSLIAYGDLLDLGVGPAVTKYVAELRARDEPAEASALIATALWIYSAVGVLVLAASVPVALVFPDLFDIAGPVRSDARWVVFLTALALAVKLPAATAYAVLRGLQRFDLVNLISVGATVVQAGATVGVLLLGWGVVGVAMVTAPLTLLTQIPMQIAVRRAAPELRFGFRGAQRRLVSSVGSFSLSLFVSNAAGVVKTKTDEIVIAAALPLASVAPYSIARRVSELPALVTYQFNRVLFPLASELHGERRRDELRELFVAATRVTIALFVPISAALIVFAGPFLNAWVGAGYGRDVDVAVILLAAAMLEMSKWPAVSLLQGTDGHRSIAFFSGAGALLNLGLSIALVRGVGVVGVALGTLVASAAEAALVIPFGLRRYNVSASAFARHVLAPALLPSVPALAVLLGIRASLHPSTIVGIVSAGLLGAVVYAIGYLAFSAGPRERTAVRQLARVRR